MPEGPEVQAVVDQLAILLRDKEIKKVDVLYPKLSQDDLSSLEGQRFEEFNRRGKYLVLTMTQTSLIVHLRMEGRFLWLSEWPKNKHVHAVFTLDDGHFLAYQDTRKFGRFRLEKDSKAYFQALGLGPEANQIQVKDLQEVCKKRTGPIKMVLLDQRVVAGIGNIYADEILFEAGIHPQTPAYRLGRVRLSRLVMACHKIINLAMASRGSSVHSFRVIDEVTGLFQQQLKVYGRKGWPCVRCGRPLVKIKVGQRGTVLCPHCQHR